MGTKLIRGILICVVSCAVALATIPSGLRAAQPQDQNGAPPPQAGPPPGQAPPGPGQDQPQPAQLTPDQLHQLVAPIALYPDALVAQILAASAYPTQIVEADRFMQQNPNLQGQALGAEVDKQDWDPSVKALTQFPSVLSDMDKNLTWTSALGDANYNQQQDVMDAIQFMRKDAEKAGHLQSTPQQIVQNQGNTVEIQPANPQIVYVPDYDPEVIYGYPVGLWPGFYNPWWGEPGPYISFGAGFGIGPFFGFGWGWPAWGFGWYHGGGVFYGGGRYAYRSPAFYNRSAYFHGGATYRGAAGYRGNVGAGYRGNTGEGYAGANRAARGYAPPARSGAFNGGATRGSDARSYSSRGQASMGGGSRGGGGGSRGGGGGHGGGGHR